MSIFDKHKLEIIENLNNNTYDNSFRGFIDQPIKELVTLINQNPNFVTTSSCSGRISIFIDTNQTKGIEWILVKHSQVSLEDISNVLASYQLDQSIDKQIVTLKCEPMILHIECKDIINGQSLHKLAMDCGFRESGLSIGQKKVMLAIRTTSNSLELPLIINQELLFTDKTLLLLVNEANKRIRNNFLRIEKFLSILKMEWKWPILTLTNQRLDSFNRWGHGQIIQNDFSYIIGGYGFEDDHKKTSRNTSILKLTKSNNQLVSHKTTLEVMNIMHATYLTIEMSGKCVVLVMGGRTNPSNALPCIGSIFHLNGESANDIIIQQQDQSPRNRWGHCCIPLHMKDKQYEYFMFGGRDDETIFNDSYILKLIIDESSNTIYTHWIELELSLPNLFFHSACVFPIYDINEDDLVICLHGGLTCINKYNINHQFYIIDPYHLTSYEIVQVKQIKRFGHQLVYLGARSILLSGGTSFEITVNTGNTTNTSTSTNTNTNTNTSNSSDDEDKGDLIINLQLFNALNENDKDNNKDMVKDVKYETNILQCEVQFRITTISRAYNIKDIPCEYCRIHHTCFQYSIHSNKDLNQQHGDYIAYGGGGAMVLAFGSHFCDSLILKVSTNNQSDVLVPNPSPNLNHSLNLNQIEDQGIHQTHDILIPTLLASKQNVKSIKTFLEMKKFLNKSQRITLLQDTVYDKKNQLIISINDMNDPITSTIIDEIDDKDIMVIPLTKTCFELIQSHNKELINELYSHVQHKVNYFIVLKCQISKNRQNKVTNTNVFHNLQEFVLNVIKTYHLPLLFYKSLPLKYEFVGDIVLIPQDAFLEEEWINLFNQQDFYHFFWKQFVEILHMKRVARKSRIHNSPKRESLIKLIFPLMDSFTSTSHESIDLSPGWVVVLENGIHYGFDITKVMFCSGNVTERMRMSKMNVSNEMIIDMYCGIGYYTLPFLFYGKPKHLIACEWNPNSIEALKYNLEVMNINTSLYTILQGDNNITTKDMSNIANRICLGLLPSSEGGWESASRLLHPLGGILHVHENVLEKDITNWIVYCINKFKSYFQLLVGKENMQIECLHIERVKSYAPRVYHIVADLQCTTTTTTTTTNTDT